MYLGGGDVPGMGGNNAYLAQARPNPLTDPRNKIKGGEPWGTEVMLPGQKERGFQNWKPLLPPGQTSLPLAYSNGFPPTSNMGAIAMGNAGVDAKALADFQTLLDQDIESRYQNPSIKESRVPEGFVRSALY